MKKITILILILLIFCPAQVISKELQLANNINNNDNGKIDIIKLNVSTNKKLKDKQDRKSVV